MSKMHRLFLVMITKYNAVNIPPILTLGESGDCVAWIVIDQNEYLGREIGANKVLHQRGFKTIAPLVLSKDPSPKVIDNETTRLLDQVQPDQIYIVSNGFTRINPLILLSILDALTKTQVPTDVIYNKTSISKLVISSPTNKKSYRINFNNNLSLKELFCCADSTMKKPEKSICFWKKSGRGQTINGRHYPKDLHEINTIHGNSYLKNTFTQLVFFGPKYRELEMLFGLDALVRWKVTAMDLLKSNKHEFTDIYYATSKLLCVDRLAPRYDQWIAHELHHKTHTAITSFRNQEALESCFEKLYTQVKKVLKHTSERRVRKANQVHLNTVVGPVFENEVAVRVQSWLDQFGKEYTVEEAWLNVTVSKNGHSNSDAEFDVLLLLAHGAVLHLECKSGVASQKDLDARLSTLRDTTSNNSKMHIVVPCYADFQEEPWFKELDNVFWRHFDELERIKLLHYTLKGQKSLSYNRFNKQAKEFYPVHILDFETALEHTLTPYKV
ncbi:MAG: hypothetical protein KAG98_05165 [Lentisphaeria bacterium]|nr:hypothetical protein [Lentisphaeria bacterium]